jgi:hypothetical protein
VLHAASTDDLDLQGYKLLCQMLPSLCGCVVAIVSNTAVTFLVSRFQCSATVLAPLKFDGLDYYTAPVNRPFKSHVTPYVPSVLHQVEENSSDEEDSINDDTFSTITDDGHRTDNTSTSIDGSIDSDEFDEFDEDDDFDEDDEDNEDVQGVLLVNWGDNGQGIVGLDWAQILVGAN